MSGRWSAPSLRWLDSFFPLRTSIFRWPRVMSSYLGGAHQWGLAPGDLLRWMDFELNFLDDVIWSVVTAFESVALVSTFCFFFLFCGCTIWAWVDGAATECLISLMGSDVGGRSRFRWSWQDSAGWEIGLWRVSAARAKRPSRGAWFFHFKVLSSNCFFPFPFMNLSMLSSSHAIIYHVFLHPKYLEI